MQIGNTAIILAIIAAFVIYGAALAWATTYASGEPAPQVTRKTRAATRSDEGK